MFPSQEEISCETLLRQAVYEGKHRWHDGIRHRQPYRRQIVGHRKKHEQESRIRSIIQLDWAWRRCCWRRCCWRGR